MQRPQPKVELKVVIASSTGVLYIYAATNDAVQWIEKEAPVFGSFFKPEQTLTNHYDLFVSELYDFNEVAEYLEKGYDNEHKGS